MFGTNLVRALALGLCCSLFASPDARASSFTPGNLVVVRMGTGSGALGNTATAVFLDEYTPSGTYTGNTIALPTTVIGANKRLTSSGSATSEGFLTLSNDGQYLLNGGYDAALGTLSVATTTSAAVNRVVGRIDLNGNVDTTTALTDAFSGSNIRSAVSTDGTQLWATGPGGSPRYALLGATTSTQLNATLNGRVGGIFGSPAQLYASTAAGTNFGVCTIGTGLPTTSGQTVTLLPGFPTTTGPSSYDFFFANPNTLYVADDRTNGSGGIQKWTLSAGTWSLQYTFAPTATSGCRGLSGTVSGGIATLFATTTENSANKIVTVTDTGAGSVITTLSTAAANTAFRGIRNIPVQCTAPSITTHPANATPCAGAPASFHVVAGGTAPLSYQWRFNTVNLVDGGNVSGATTDTLSINPAGVADQGSYDVVVTNACGSATSSAATLMLNTTDTDGDSTPDCSDGCPMDPLKVAPGACGCGIADTDTDGDMTPDCTDGCPMDPLKIAPGACGCGIADVDTDGDSTLDCNDGCPNDPLKIAPGACGCGIADVDTDGDSTPDCHDGCPMDPLKIAPGACGCGIADVDTDGDSTPDCNDGCPNDPSKIAPGQCGCGIADTDTDGDSTADCHDGCPNDPSKIAPGVCGCGVADADTDADTVPDCHDNCASVANTNQADSDGDLIGNACDNCPRIPNASQADCNGNGVGDACEIAAGTPDCNANGVPDACDISSSTSADANLNGIPDECEVNGGTPFCFGYGTPTSCPCANNSAPGSGQGCLNSSGSGGMLAGTGLTKVSADGLVLTASNMTGGTCVFLQGDALTNIPFGDGLRCAHGTLKRLATKPVVSQSATYPQGADIPISVKGLVPPAGGVRYYQVFYRNPTGSPCGTLFNITAGVSVIWQP